MSLSVPIGGHSALASSCPRDSTFISQPRVLTAWEAATKTVRKQSFGVTETRLSGTTLAGLESLIPHPHLVGVTDKNEGVRLSSQGARLGAYTAL